MRDPLSMQIDKCTHGGMAACMKACPFRLDIRLFTERMQQGKTDAAYKLYRDAVVFPGIVSALCPAPCERVCERAQTDESVQLSLIERACVEHAGAKTPTKYNLPQKHKRILILGAGLCGLTCGLKLARQNYDVTLCELADRPGGSLSRYLPEPVYARDIELQFEKVRLTWMLGVDGRSIPATGFDAVFVSHGIDRSASDAVFFEPEALSPMAKIAEGARMFSAIEWYVKTGQHLPERHMASMRAITRNTVPITRMPAVKPENGISFSGEEAARAAARCVRCDCDACARHCGLLQKYKVFPPRLRENVEATLNPAQSIAQRVATRLIASCDQCGLCSSVCPEGIDVCGYLLDARQRLQQAGALPPVFHEFWLRDMEFSDTDTSALFLPDGAKTTEYAFFPGCQMGASDPRYVETAYAYLQTKLSGVALWLRCCGVPALWSGDRKLFDTILGQIEETWAGMGKPTLIVACPSCAKNLHCYLPNIPCQQLYKFMAEQDAGHSLGNNQPLQALALFDPCASRDWPDLQAGVRRLLADAGISTQELSSGGRNSQCCSWGGQSGLADPELSAAMAERRAGQSDLPYVTYCMNCRDIFASKNKPCLHILDVLFGVNTAFRAPPTISERRRNRMALRMRFAPHARVSCAQDAIRVVISPDLAQRLSDALILESDIVSIIQACERRRCAIVDMDSAERIAYEQRGHCTYWAVYTYDQTANEYLVLDAYSHRMQFEPGV